MNRSLFETDICHSVKFQDDSCKIPAYRARTNKYTNERLGRAQYLRNLIGYSVVTLVTKRISIKITANVYRKPLQKLTFLQEIQQAEHTNTLIHMYNMYKWGQSVLGDLHHYNNGFKLETTLIVKPCDDSCAYCTIHLYPMHVQMPSLIMANFRKIAKNSKI